MDEGIHRLGQFLMLTGCRPAEAKAVRWCDVSDLPTPRMLVHGKGSRERHLPLSGKLGKLIQSIPRVGEAVFPVENGRRSGQCFAYWPKNRWQAVCEAAGVPSAPYDLRHTFITDLVGGGVPIAKVAKWAGNSVRVIETRYAHWQPDHLEDVLRLADSVLPDVSEGQDE